MSDNFAPSTSSPDANSTTMNTPFAASTVNEIPADCKLAEIAVQDMQYNWIRIAHIVCGLIITFLLFKIVRQAHRVRVPLHGNLKILLINVLFNYGIFAWSYILTSARFLIIYFIHTNPCDCLTPIWLAYALRMPAYVYLIASPLLHFAIMVERVRATLFVHNYEREGIRCGIGGIIVVWVITALFSLYIVFSSLADTETFSKPLVYISMTTKYNSQVFINIHYFFLFLVVCISLADYLLIRLNRKVLRQKENTIRYSLSQNYQASENIGTMRIIFPLDFSYTLFFTVFIIISAIVRMDRDSLGMLKYLYYYEGIQLILSLHAIITLWAYLYFLRIRQRVGQEMNRKGLITAEEEAKQYFKQLQRQWAT